MEQRSSDRKGHGLVPGRICVVTGAATGIGRGIALALAKEGAWIAVTDINVEGAQLVAMEIEQAGGSAIAYRLDVRNREEIDAALAAVLEWSGRLDIWVNNAGVSTMNWFVDLDEDEWDFNMNTNARGVFLCSQAAARQMIAQRQGGRIISVASMAGKRGEAPFLAHYIASKFAVVGLTQAMATELVSHGILVNAVCPGYVQTSMQEREVVWESRLRGISTEAVRQSYVDDTPLARLETTEDVAKVVVFLASEYSDFMTGQAINITGGSWMH